MQPDLKHIRALAAIKEHGSFRQAAQSLRISAPGLTKIIQALEHGLGVELVDRTARPVSLTKYGQAVCDQGTEALASIEPIDAPPLPDANMILAWYDNTPITILLKDTILANQDALPGD